jgi:hypothetical protein
MSEGIQLRPLNRLGARKLNGNGYTQLPDSDDPQNIHSSSGGDADTMNSPSTPTSRSKGKRRARYNDASGAGDNEERLALLDDENDVPEQWKQNKVCPNSLNMLSYSRGVVNA